MATIQGIQFENDANGNPQFIKIDLEKYGTQLRPFLKKVGVELEKDAHRQLSSYRVNARREFFRVEIEKAAQLLRQAADQLQHQLSLIDGEFSFRQEGVQYEAIEMLDSLCQRFSNVIKTEIASVKMYQTNDRCCLEVTEEQSTETIWGYQDRLIDQVIRRRDLGFITNGDEEPLLFKPSKSVIENARIFVEEFDDYSVLMTCGDLLFTDEGCQMIASEHEGLTLRRS
jgi:hypothetical protein